MDVRLMTELKAPLMRGAMGGPVLNRSVDTPVRPRLVEVASWLIRVAASADEQIDIPELITAVAAARLLYWRWFRIGGTHVSIGSIIIGKDVACQSDWECVMDVPGRSAGLLSGWCSGIGLIRALSGPSWRPQSVELKGSIRRRAIRLLMACVEGFRF